MEIFLLVVFYLCMMNVGRKPIPTSFKQDMYDRPRKRRK